MRWLLTMFAFVGAILTVCAADKDILMSIKIEIPNTNTLSQSILVISNAQQTISSDAQGSLEPLASDASDPRRLVRYFCRMWKDEEYERMYLAMTPEYRKTTSLEKFSDRFKSDAARTGGLKDENIVFDDVDEGNRYIITVDLRFNNVRVIDRRVKVSLEKRKREYRIAESGIIPLNLEDL